jgi:hypothetical protein
VCIFRAVAELELMSIWGGAEVWVQGFAAATSAQVAACEVGDLGLLLESWYTLGRHARGQAAAAAARSMSALIAAEAAAAAPAAVIRSIEGEEVGGRGPWAQGGLLDREKAAEAEKVGAGVEGKLAPADAANHAGGGVACEAVAPESWWLAVAECLCRCARSCSSNQLGYLMRTAGRVMPRGSVKTLGGRYLNLRAVFLRRGLPRALFKAEVLQEADSRSLSAIAWGAGRLGLFVPGHVRVGVFKAVSQGLPGATPAVLVQLLEAFWMLQLLQPTVVGRTAVRASSNAAAGRTAVRQPSNVSAGRTAVRPSSHAAGVRQDLGQIASQGEKRWRATQAETGRRATAAAAAAAAAVESLSVAASTTAAPSRLAATDDTAAAAAESSSLSSSASAAPSLRLAAAADPARLLVQSIAQRAWEQLPYFKGSQLARLLVTLGQLGFRPKRELLEKALLRLQGKLRFMTPTALAQVRRIWGLVKDNVSLIFSHPSILLSASF